VCYLATRIDAWDALAEAAAVVGLLFCSIGLASGMIWGHSAWNVWWRWEPRLVSFLVLWLILLAYVLQRGFSLSHARQKNFAAVLGILSAVNVPIVIFSIKLLDHTEQLHPEVVAKQGLRDASYLYTFALSNVALLMFAIWLLSVTTTNVLLRRRVESLSE
jgi:heme exporter protein C